MFTCRGYRYDTETGLYYLESRYYNPEWGRFINADGIVGQTGELLAHNMFAYCKNNPENMEDSSGFRYEFSGTARDTGYDATVSFAVMNHRYDFNAGIVKTNSHSISSANNNKSLTEIAIDSFKETNILIKPILILAVTFTYENFDLEDEESMAVTKKVQKGKAFRAGKKANRDKWFGYDNKDFQNWWHREGKKQYGGNDIEDSDMAKEIFNYWDSVGRPKVK